MTKLAEVEELIRSLSVADRLRLLETTWDSLDDADKDQPLPDWQRIELDKRIEAFKRNPDAGRPWQDVIAEIRADLGK